MDGELRTTSETCLICGEPLEEGFDLCERHVEDAFTLMTAIMQAKSANDVIIAWTTWKNGEGRNKTTFLDNCRNCGKLMWIEPWERRNGRHGGQYCSRECKAQASRNTVKAIKQSPKDKQGAVLNIDAISPPSEVSAPTKNPDAVALGRLGGLKGGKARLEKLTPERRKEIARNAVNARWNKKRNGDSEQATTKVISIDENSRCPKCGTKTLERDGTDLHCWACGHIIYHVFGRN